MMESRTGIVSPGILTQAQASVIYSTPELVTAALNDVFHTNHAVDYPPLRALLSSYISQGFDFGAIYARIRRSWPVPTQGTLHESLDAFLARMSEVERLGESARRTLGSSIRGQTIITTEEYKYSPSLGSARQPRHSLS
ncbi:hypothetical protein SCHPADRAFT_293870 [Schizopora paradoxa]|uniref:Uncharacterized protein n=1 Tax=Schizopora paradoxa TaxID=27342 RepID=A0A0H2RZ68_9AGAM|nr:hypothetical protein SCHPADRAFT_293870 [Schizopora paradoxa]